MRFVVAGLVVVLFAGCLESNPQPSPGREDGIDKADPDQVGARTDTLVLDVAAPWVDVVADAAGKDGADGAAETDVPDVGDADGADVVECLAVDPDPGVSELSGYLMDGWGWGARSVVLEPPVGTATGLGYRAPALVVVEGKLHLYYAHYLSPTEWVARHATSLDGVVWTDAGPVQGVGSDAGTLAVVYDQGLFRLWHGAGSIEQSTSVDGHKFELVPQSSFGPSAQATFDTYSVLHPAVVWSPPLHTMYYTGFDGQGFAIGSATSADGVVWQRQQSEPVLTKGAAGEFDNAAVAQSAVVQVASGFLMWYGGYDTSKTNPGPYRIGLAQSADGLVWQKKGVSLELSAQGTDAYSTRDPAVVRHGSGWLMVYVGMGEDMVYRLKSATSAVCNQ